MISVMWLVFAISGALCICGLNTFALLALWSAKRRQNEIFAERNKHLAENTKMLDKHNEMLEEHKNRLNAIGEILIALYPDYDSPEPPNTRRMRKAKVVEMWRRVSD